MYIYKKYSDEEYKKFLSLPFGETFGISDNDLANWFVNQRGAQAVVVSYGVNTDNLVNTYIPELKKAFGGAVIFLMATVTEGGGAGNWLNHYGSDTSPDGLGCLKDDIAYVKTTFDRDFPPAMSAPEVGGTYVEDREGLTMEVYNAVPDGSIGSYFIPSTMAGNSWIFGGNWSEANRGPQAPAVYYGNPYDQIIDAIKSFGADPFKSGNTAKPNPDTPKQPKEPEAQPQLTDVLKNAFDKIIETINDGLKKDVYFGSHSYYMNSNVRVFTKYGNMKQVDFTDSFKKSIMKLLNLTDLNLVDKETGKHGAKPKEDPPQQSIVSGKDNKTSQLIYDWCIANQGQAFDADGAWGAQCVDLIHQISDVFNLNLPYHNNPNYGVPETYYAKRIFENDDLPPNWEKIHGDPSDDDKSREIWNKLPNGCVVWWTNADAGHVGIKAGDWCVHLGQNYGTDGNGGPIVLADLASWIAGGGAGFLGAWVPK